MFLIIPRATSTGAPTERHETKKDDADATESEKTKPASSASSASEKKSFTKTYIRSPDSGRWDTC